MEIKVTIVAIINSILINFDFFLFVNKIAVIMMNGMANKTMLGV